MASFTRLPRIPRASGSDAGLIKPDTWNTLVTNVEALERRFLSIQPKPSADIGIKSAPDGFTPFIKKHNKGAAFPSCPLTPSGRTVEEELRIYVSPGLSGDLVPTLDAVELTAIPAPYIVITDTTKLWLSVEWEPVAELDGSDYYITGGGSAVAVEFVESTTRPTETEAAIDISTGAATNGIYVFLWAEITVTPVGDPPVGVISIPAHRCGNHQFTFCPSSIKLLFD